MGMIYLRSGKLSAAAICWCCEHAIRNQAGRIVCESGNNSESYRDWSVGVLGGSGGYWDALGVLLGLLYDYFHATCDRANPPRGGELQMAVSAAPSPRHAAQARSGVCRARLDAKMRRPAQLRPRFGSTEARKTRQRAEIAPRRPTQPASRGTSQRDPRPALAPACAGHGPMPVRPKPAHTRRARG